MKHFFSTSFVFCSVLECSGTVSHEALEDLSMPCLQLEGELVVSSRYYFEFFQDYSYGKVNRTSTGNEYSMSLTTLVTYYIQESVGRFLRAHGKAIGLRMV